MRLESLPAWEEAAVASLLRMWALGPGRELLHFGVFPSKRDNYKFIVHQSNPLSHALSLRRQEFAKFGP